MRYKYQVDSKRNRISYLPSIAREMIRNLPYEMKRHILGYATVHSINAVRKTLGLSNSDILSEVERVDAKYSISHILHRLWQSIEILNRAPSHWHDICNANSDAYYIELCKDGTLYIETESRMYFSTDKYSITQSAVGCTINTGTDSTDIYRLFVIRMNPHVDVEKCIEDQSYYKSNR
jgi:hypothetical protein